jgi:hypothetical protein
MVVRQMSEVWVFSGSGTQKHKRDTAVYHDLGYLGPTSSSEVCSSCSRAPKLRGCKENGTWPIEFRFWCLMINTTNLD